VKDMGKEIENSIGYYIVKIAQDRRQWLNNRLEQHDITLSQIGVLNCLWDKDGLTQKEIQKILDIKPSSLTALIDILVEKQIVTRREDENDARVKRIFLTNKGSSLKGISMEELLGVEQKLIEGFSKEEAALLLLWLKRVRSNVLLNKEENI
jgi:DNA-binding MarR family transcriptional regulator